MKQKIIVISVLVVIAGAAVYFYSGQKSEYWNTYSDAAQSSSRPLPELTSAKKRLDSYTPARGDIKYRVVPKPVVSTDPNTGWNLYTSKDYGFSFIFPPNAPIESTESLGYQLPSSQAYKGSRDNFEIKITNKEVGAYYLLFLNYPNFQVSNTTTTAQSLQTISGLSMVKKILQSTNPSFSSSQIITYTFEKSGRSYIWYGTFDSKDFESINNFESIVGSMRFN